MIKTNKEIKENRTIEKISIEFVVVVILCIQLVASVDSWIERIERMREKGWTVRTFRVVIRFLNWYLYLMKRLIGILCNYTINRLMFDSWRFNLNFITSNDNMPRCASIIYSTELLPLPRLSSQVDAVGVKIIYAQHLARVQRPMDLIECNQKCTGAVQHCILFEKCRDVCALRRINYENTKNHLFSLRIDWQPRQKMRFYFVFNMAVICHRALNWIPITCGVSCCNVPDQRKDDDTNRTTLGWTEWELHILSAKQTDFYRTTTVRHPNLHSACFSHIFFSLTLTFPYWTRLIDILKENADDSRCFVSCETKFQDVWPLFDEMDSQIVEMELGNSIPFEKTTKNLFYSTLRWFCFQR